MRIIAPLLLEPKLPTEPSATSRVPMKIAAKAAMSKRLPKEKCMG
jgi:hypothetical protein